MTNFTELKQAIQEMREAGVPDIDGILDTHLGICSTCVHSEDCNFLQNSAKAIYHCEEFDSHEAPVIKDPVPGAYASSTAKPVETSLKGLCRNCTKSSTCSFHKPEGGIWHCEEYE